MYIDKCQVQLSSLNCDVCRKRHIVNLNSWEKQVHEIDRGITRETKVFPCLSRLAEEKRPSDSDEIEHWTVCKLNPSELQL